MVNDISNKSKFPKLLKKLIKKCVYVILKYDKGDTN